MLEAVKEPTKKPAAAEPKKAPKLRLDPIQPTHIVDVWRLYERFVRDQSQAYPDMTEEPAEVLQSHLFVYLQNTLFKGLQARVGKRVVGVVLGHVGMRPMGRPKTFLSVTCLYVDPAFRKRGIGKALWKEYTDRMKKAQIFNFEAYLTDEMVSKHGLGKPMAKLFGGKL